MSNTVAFFAEHYYLSFWVSESGGWYPPLFPASLFPSEIDFDQSDLDATLDSRESSWFITHYYEWNCLVCIPSYAALVLPPKTLIFVICPSFGWNIALREF